MSESVAAQPAPLTSHSRVAGLFDSDILYSFRRSRLTMLAALVTLLIIVSAVFAPWIAPHNVFDLGQVSLMNSNLPPAWLEGGSREFLFGTDDQGRDIFSTILYG
ncbi:MAG: ABC transporter permease, partial [Burkholderiales bacterium]|nr:ABC transporter permease [Phycisphaerae bacterium]